MKALMNRAIAALMSAFIPRWPGPYLHPGWHVQGAPNGNRRRSGVPAARRAARKRRNGRRRHG